MKCRKVAQELPAYLANELGGDKHGRVERHLKHCPLCASELRALEKTGQLLDTLGDIEPRRDLVGLVMSRIERERDAEPALSNLIMSLRSRWANIGWAQVRYAATNVLILLLLAFGLHRYSQVRRPPAETTPNVAISTVHPDGTRPAETARPNWFNRVITFRPRLIRVTHVPPTSVAPPKDGDFRIPLNESDFERLDRDLKDAESGGGPRDPADIPETWRLPELRRNNSPTRPVEVELLLGPNGTLIIAPGSQRPSQPAE